MSFQGFAERGLIHGLDDDLLRRISENLHSISSVVNLATSCSRLHKMQGLCLSMEGRDSHHNVSLME